MPTVPIEDLGDNTSYFNFNVVESKVEDEEGETYLNYDYDQVRITNPVTIEKIEAALTEEGYNLEDIEI